MKLTENEKRVEAVLFASSRRMNEEEILNILKTDKKNVNEALEGLKKKYSENNNSLQIVKENDTWKISLKSDYMPLAENLIPATELPNVVIETLAIIAWKSPVLQSEIVRIRSSSAYDHITQLEKMGLITRSKKGRSYIVKVTDKFYDYFDVPPEKAEEAFKSYNQEEEQPEEEEENEFNKGDSFDKGSFEREKKLMDEIKENKINPDEIINKDEEFLKEFDKKLNQINQNNEEINEKAEKIQEQAESDDKKSE
ncbi:MAG: SMC-Scp complex subunit ScpB [Nanobdellota archaeon]